jgi:ABC-type phosphate/phosphonate transport system ATPase subunit
VAQPFVFARCQLRTPQTEQEKQFSKLPTWIQQKFNIPSSQSWDKVILFFSQDEHTALEQLFKLFNEFVHADNHHEIESVDTQSASDRP